ncbi:hypothetical protein OG413_45365 [Streptomyces sp. NBC_01433]|uniref:hypothetical protein n=1 Tax=Streptomyces sp. NBC_01433 TaxID=2903864 RepID=UPI002257FFA0|nr:hypothetical protein [Streptomyces sp. NBC_01433]MCX4681340.1 hypothetical protein [Streptomyces sp. NBC_01433]MCX4681722.1 hypothetical protein [Streptomyces sp. NBC_01433]MCX4682416.1 hypothetical protein [Streptomyces sp. NBC_01433]
MPVLRQLTACSAPATHVVESRCRKKGRALEYRVEVCERHRWIAGHWPGRRTRREPGGQCGTMADHRAYTQVVQSHVDMWIGPLTTQDLERHGGDAAAALRAAHQWLQDAYGDCSTARGDIWHAVAAALGHAAWLAEAVAAGLVDAAEGEQQVLAALSSAETIDSTARGV